MGHAARRRGAAVGRRRPRAERRSPRTNCTPATPSSSTSAPRRPSTWSIIRGAYKGGIIAPGINLSLDALVTAAAALPRIAIEAPAGNKSVIGRNTVDQMHIGIYWGYVAMIEGLVARMRAEVGRPVKVIATGGLAILFEKNTDVFDAIAPDLTLSGWRFWSSAPIY